MKKAIDKAISEKRTGERGLRNVLWEGVWVRVSFEGLEGRCQ
jgi:hypothetical protein